MRYFVSLLIMGVVMITGCGPKPSARIHNNPRPLTSEERDRIIETAESYIDTPYRRRGQNPSGFDCSGFVYNVYLEAIDLELPRSTKELFEVSRPINVNDARPGDFIFFSINGNARPDHVGLIINREEFIHSSKSKGVTISYLKDQYYRRKFLSVRTLRYELIAGNNEP
ncbi:MAG: C40 family peptidase [candidate division Zixibacteria bacterium]|nr:C40 family peptidase [candidate division Zixibacteria bacterium]